LYLMWRDIHHSVRPKKIVPERVKMGRPGEGKITRNRHIKGKKEDKAL